MDQAIIDKKLLKYIRLMFSSTQGTAMRLQKNNAETGWEYWRAAGLWGIDYRWEGDKLVSDSTKRYLEDMLYLDGKELKEITEDEWRKNNKGYV